MAIFSFFFISVVKFERQRATILMGDGKVRFFVRKRVEQREGTRVIFLDNVPLHACLLYTSPSPRDS